MHKFWAKYNNLQRAALVTYVVIVLVVVTGFVLRAIGLAPTAFPSVIIVPCLIILAGALQVVGSNPRGAHPQENDPNRR